MTPLEALEPIVRLILVATGIGLLAISTSLLIGIFLDPENQDDTPLLLTRPHWPTPSRTCPDCLQFIRPCCDSLLDDPHRWSCATWGDLDELSTWAADPEEEIA